MDILKMHCCIIFSKLVNNRKNIDYTALKHVKKHFCLQIVHKYLFTAPF